jgi:hypothetical protein
MEEKALIDKAVKKLQELTGITTSYRNNDTRTILSGVIKLGKYAEFIVEAKNELREQHFFKILNQVKSNKKPIIIIAKYIPFPLKVKFKNEGVNYLEAAGNCYINDENLFIYINDQKVTPEREENKSRLWNPAGLRFVFTILSKPDLLNAPYREIADNAKVALGTVGKLLKDLQEEGFAERGVINKKHLLFLERKDLLIDKWITLYNTTLRPKIELGNFRTKETDPLQNIKLPNGLLWGGEMAGAKLTNFLRPENHILYSGIPKMEVMKSLKLIPDTGGNIKLLNKFWTNTLTNNLNKEQLQIAPLLIVYADLLSTSDSRNYETAERIKPIIYGM